MKLFNKPDKLGYYYMVNVENKSVKIAKVMQKGNNRYVHMFGLPKPLALEEIHYNEMFSYIELPKVEDFNV